MELRWQEGDVLIHIETKQTAKIVEITYTGLFDIVRIVTHGDDVHDIDVIKGSQIKLTSFGWRNTK